MNMPLRIDMDGQPLDPHKLVAALTPLAEVDARRICGWLEALPHPVALLRQGDDGHYVAASNAGFERIKGRDLIASDGGPIAAMADAVLAGERENVARVWEQPGPSGRVFEVTVAALPDEEFDARQALLSLVDRTTLVRSEANLRRELLSDSLTGLPNRSGLCDRVEQRLAEGGGSVSTTLLTIDLLRFSRINESIGALAGDELLLTVARRLSQRLRGGDMLARIGADEFALLCENGGGRCGARRIARRIADCFVEPFRIGSLLINVDCAIGGIADIARAGTNDGADLVRHAQIALKQAKMGDGLALYEPIALSNAHHRFDLETALRSAIAQGQIDLAFQPLVDMRQRRIIGFEALSRWTHEGVRIGPDEFVPIAEDSGLIVPLGRYVLGRALDTLAEWDARHGSAVPVHMAVNFSPIQLTRDDIAALVQGELQRSGIAGNRLMVEVTESCVIENADEAGGILRSLAALDVRIAMDDFGTGYSNIANLQRLPIDTLKIDRSLVAGIDSSADSLAIVRTIQRLGEALGMKTTAEGIETDAIAQRIAAIGCNAGQGYLFSKPLDADAAFAAWATSVKRGEQSF